jgi:hypothetical protein
MHLFKAKKHALQANIHAGFAFDLVLQHLARMVMPRTGTGMPLKTGFFAQIKP